MNKFKAILMGITCIVCIVLIILITNNQVEGMFIHEVNPEKIVAGQKFNEVNGISTMGVTGKGYDEQSIIYINDIPQETTFGNTQFLTCFVDDSIYQNKGTLDIQVKNKDKESNKYKIKVH